MPPDSSSARSLGSALDACIALVLIAAAALAIVVGEGAHVATTALVVLAALAKLGSFGLRAVVARDDEARERRNAARLGQARALIDEAAEGLFVVNREGALVSDPSLPAIRRLGKAQAKDTLFTYLGRTSTPFAEEARAAWAQVADDSLPVEVALAQLPTDLTTKESAYTLAVKPFAEGASFVVSIADRTVASAYTRELVEQRETATFLARLAADEHGLRDLFEEMSRLVERIGAKRSGRSELKRDVHTLKGNALVYGLESLAARCNAIEEEMLETRALPAAESLADLVAIWTRLTKPISQLVEKRSGVVDVSVRAIESLAIEARKAGASAALLRRIDDLARDPIAPRLQRLAAEAKRIAEGTGKLVDVTIVDGGVRVETARWSALWAAMIHAVRNAVDHGIELPADRAAAGKPKRGLITFRARRDDDRVVVEIGDDGHGIDWNGVKNVATQVGFETTNADELTAALFVDGVSTGLTSVSGRGVGMGALRDAVERLGGKLDVESAPGEGTFIRVIVPDETRAASAPAQRPVVAARA